MKLEIARGVFLVGALGVASLCAAAWSEPDAAVIQCNNGLGHCPLPSDIRTSLVEQKPEKELLLFLYSLTQHLGIRN